jgi:hypothetical protein
VYIYSRKKLAQFKKKKQIVGYKIVKVLNNNLTGFVNGTVYVFNSKKILIWDNGKCRFNYVSEKTGFSFLLNKKDAIIAYNYQKKKYANISQNLQIYKVVCSNIVNAGTWEYFGNKECRLDNMNVAEAKILKFIKRIK